MLSTSLERVILQYFEDLSCPFSLRCAIMWRNGERAEIARLKVRQSDYGTPEDYLRAAACVAFIKKIPNLSDESSANRRKATYDKWVEGETDCYRTNLRLTPYLSNQGRDSHVYEAIRGIRKIIRGWIGPGPTARVTGGDQWYEYDLNGRHGPGATFNDKSVAATVAHKFQSVPTMTKGSFKLLPTWFQTSWALDVLNPLDRCVSIVNGDRFATAPKTFEIERPICIGPSINVFYQLAVGTLFRRLLSRNAGWDLSIAAAKHKLIAKLSSVTREFATLDLRNASDTVAKVLVKLLFPHRWWVLLDMLRSAYTIFSDADSHEFGYCDADSKRVINHLNEKFSAMGNGYTFELESIIFAAITCYATQQAGYAGVLGLDVFVFGDDIICRDGVVSGVVALLKFFGFSLNMEKSFWGMSPFRESCGADFWVGTDVRPSYLKKDPENVEEAIGVCNRIAATVGKLTGNGDCSDARSWRTAVSYVPVPYRLFGPSGLGDAVIWSQDQGSYRHKYKWRNSIRYYKVVKPGELRVVKFGRFAPSVVLTCALYGSGNVGTPEHGVIPLHEGLTPRDAVRSYVTGWRAYS